jgi:hypothetical protein
MWVVKETSWEAAEAVGAGAAGRTFLGKGNFMSAWSSTEDAVAL